VTQIQIAAGGSQTDVLGTARITVTDPQAEVRSIGFFVTGGDGRRTGPLPADRALTGGIYEKDLILDAARSTRAQAAAVAADGSVVLSTPMTFGSRFEPLTAPAGALGATAFTPSSRSIAVTTSLGSAASWKCFARKGAQPTVDGTTATPLDDAWLRYDEPATSFTMSADPGTWYVSALGYNSAGQAGPIASATVQVTT
jgi:hypothetical protein